MRKRRPKRARWVRENQWRRKARAVIPGAPLTIKRRILVQHAAGAAVNPGLLAEADHGVKTPVTQGPLALPASSTNYYSNQPKRAKLMRNGDILVIPRPRG